MIDNTKTIYNTTDNQTFVYNQLQNNNQIMEQKVLHQPQFLQNLFFVPPPINQTQKDMEQFDKDLGLNNYFKNYYSIQSCNILGEERSLHPKENNLQEPVYVNQETKNNLKKLTKKLFFKMLQSFNVFSGKSIQKNYSMSTIQNSADQLFDLCHKIKVGQTRIGVLKIMKQQTKQLIKKTEQLQNCINDIQQELQPRAFN